jgi:hypothetical protein
MSVVDHDWFTGEHQQQVLAPAKQTPARPGKLPAQQRAAIEDIARRYPGDLNDELPSDL